MDSKKAVRVDSAPKKTRKGKVHIPRAPKLCAPEQLLAREQQAHKETRIKLDAALARLKTMERECSSSKEAMQQQLCGLSAELRQKQTDLRTMSSQVAEASDVAAALDATVTEMSARLLAQERALQQQQQRSAAQELAAHKQQAAAAAAELSRLQLAHAAMLVERVQYKRTATACIASMQQQLQDKDASLSRAEACKQAALNDLAASQFDLQAAATQIAVLQQQLADTQDSLAQLQYKCQAAQDDAASQKNATFVAEAKITDLELYLEYLTASRSEMQRRCELLLADLAAHKAAASTAECRIASMHVQLQDSSSTCAELVVAHQAAYDDLAQQASAAAVASAAAYTSRIQELEGLLKDALAELQQQQLAKEASLDLLTDIAADTLVSHAASEFVMGQRLKAADTAAKAQRDKFAVRGAELRGYKWRLAKSQAGNKRMQHEATQLHHQLAAAAEAAIQLKVQLQTAVWGRTAATMQVEEQDTRTRVVKQQLCVTKQKLADAEDQLFGWTCAAAATSLSATNPASSPATTADGVHSSPTPTVLLHSSLPSPSQGGSSQRSQSSSIEPGWKPLTQPPVTSLPYQQLPVSANQDVPVSADDEKPSRVLLANQDLRLKVAPYSTNSKPPIRVPKLYYSLNKMIKRFGVLCSGGLSSRSTSPQALDEVAIHQEPVLNSGLGSKHTSTAPSSCAPLHGIADLNGVHDNAATQQKYHTAAAAEAAAAGAATITDTESGITGSTAVAAVPCLGRWGNAAAATGIAEHSSPRTSPNSAGSHSFTGFMGPHVVTTEGLSADVAVGGIVDTEVDDYDDLAVDGETVAVMVVEKSAGTKAGLPAVAVMTDVGALDGM